jgi:hypothetical protein
MARSTFEGPILSGDTRFGPLRNVGYTSLVQSAALDLTNTTANTAGFSGSSGVFVDSNAIPNTTAVVYTPSSSTFPSVAATIPADSATNIYRGFVAFLPVNSRINDIFVDIGVVPTVAAGTLTSVQVLVSNNYTAAAGTATYAATAVLTSPAVGRQSLATFTSTQLANQQATSTDVLQANGNPNLSQVVFTIALVGTSMTTASAGTLYFTVRYTQADGNIGSATAYPYGNFD